MQILWLTIESALLKKFKGNFQNANENFKKSGN
jgi:hypothetical protein